MFRVTKPTMARLPSDYRFFGLVPVLLACVLAAGPVFFAYALFVALYMDLPTVDIAAKQPIATHAARSKDANGALLSPLTNRDAEPGTSVQAATNEPDEDTPLMAYRRLRTAQINWTDAESIDGAIEAAPVSEKASRGSIRTVCVRLCDGYFFPIGRVSTRSELSNHAALCTARCSAPARLFYYSEPDGGPEKMQDLAGRSYLSLATAFGYQKTVSNDCGCRPQPWSAAARDLHRRYAEATGSAAGLRQIAEFTPRKPVRTIPPAMADVWSVEESRTQGLLPATQVAKQLASLPPAATVVARSQPAAPELPATLAAKVERGTILANLNIDFSPDAQQLARPATVNALRGAQPYELELASIQPLTASVAASPVQVAGWRRSDRYHRGLSADEILRHNIERQF